MGAFYGSVQVRTSDVGAVVGAVKALRVKCLVGPALRGWVGVYPEMNGQDSAVGDSISGKLNADAFWLCVQDSDVFAYRFYRGGKLADEFDSNPAYFEAGRGAGGEFRGGPEVYADLLPAGVAVEQVRAVLEEASEHVMAEDGLEAFCAVLGIANGLTAYEYLKDGETEGVEGWEEFVEWPDPGIEVAREAARAEKVARANVVMQAAGKLLGQFVGGMGKHFPLHPVWCAERGAGGGFLVAWGTAEEWVTRLERVRGPGWGKAERVGIELDRRVHSLGVSGSGKYVGVGYAAGRWEAEVWEIGTGKLVATVGVPRAASQVEFVGDELVVVRSEEVVIAEAGSGRGVGSLKVFGGGRVLALHPSGKWGVTDGGAGMAVFELPSGRMQRNLLVGGAASMAGMMREGIVEHVKIARAAGKEDLAREWEARLAELTPAAEAATRIARQSAEALSGAAFDGSGRWLAVATNRGVRVLEWERVLAERERSPEPVAAAAAEVVVREAFGRERAAGYTYGVAWDDARGEVLYCGVEGKVSALPVSGGEPRTVIEPPGGLWLTGVGLGAGGGVVGVAGQSRRIERRGRTPGVFQVWGYGG